MIMATFAETLSIQGHVLNCEDAEHVTPEEWGVLEAKDAVDRGPKTDWYPAHLRKRKICRKTLGRLRGDTVLGLRGGAGKESLQLKNISQKVEVA